MSVTNPRPSPMFKRFIKPRIEPAGVDGGDRPNGHGDLLITPVSKPGRVGHDGVEEHASVTNPVFGVVHTFKPPLTAVERDTNVVVAPVLVDVDDKPVIVRAGSPLDEGGHVALVVKPRNPAVSVEDFVDIAR